MEIVNMTENVLSIFRRIANAIEELNSRNKKIDWEQRRYEIAKECISKYQTSNKEYQQKFAVEAVEFADALIEELKKTNN